MGRYAFSRHRQKRLRAMAERSRRRLYPGDWVCDFIPGDGKSFDYSLVFHECGIFKMYRDMGAGKYLPYLCLIDYATFRAFGVGMSRDETLGNGGRRCNFKYIRGHDTAEGWPPENLPEFTGRFYE